MPAICVPYSAHKTAPLARGDSQMQLFQVKSPSGELIMNAPLETITKVWRINSLVTAHILRHTVKLDAEYVICFAAEHGGWPKTLHVSRLPLEIPQRPEAAPNSPFRLVGDVELQARYHDYLGTAGSDPYSYLQWKLRLGSKVLERPPGLCTDRNCNWPECGCVFKKNGNMQQPQINPLGDLLCDQ